MSMFETKRQEVLRLKDNKQFEESIKVCDMVLTMIQRNNINSNTDKWFFTLRKGMNYRKLGQCRKALACVKESIHYCSTQDEYIESINMMGNCNDMLGNKKRAVKFYNKCLDYYRKNNMHNEECYILFNINRL